MGAVADANFDRRPPVEPISPQRVALNETTFRRVNEGIEEGRSQREGLVAFVCECGAPGCNELVEMTLLEYEAVRADSRAFTVVPSHLIEPDELARREDRYWVVRKPDGPLGDLADRTDPRREHA
jgi:hypothetical protein